MVSWSQDLQDALVGWESSWFALILNKVCLCIIDVVSYMMGDVELASLPLGEKRAGIEFDDSTREFGVFFPQRNSTGVYAMNLAVWDIVSTL